MILGATIGASLLVIDTLFPIHILASIGLTYSITIIGGLVLGVVLIILTENSRFEDLVGIRNIEVLPDVCRWASYSLFTLSALLLLNDFSPQISQATGLPINSIILATGAYLAGVLTLIREAILGSA